MLPKGYKTILAWMQEVAAADYDYSNPLYSRQDDESEDEVPQGGIEFHPLEVHLGEGEKS